MINNIFPYKPEPVIGIGCVVRLYSGTDINIFNQLLTKLFEINFNIFLFVMDRSIDVIQITEHDNFTTEEKKLIDAIAKVFINKNYILLTSSDHYNGTGSFNIAFNFIRRNPVFSKYLWQFCDDDDDIDSEKFNKLIDMILNIPERYLNFEVNKNICEYEYKKNDEKIYKLKIQNGTKTASKYNTTSAEQLLINKFNTFIFTTEMIINHASATKTHLFEGMHTSDCNLWSYLFSPYYFHNLSCRLLPMGREDLDMINYLMIASNLSEYNGIHKYVINSTETQKDYPFMVPNNLIRINAVACGTYDESYDAHYFTSYTHKKSNDSSGYKGLYNLQRFHPSVIKYMNNHQQVMQNVEHPSYPITIPNRRNQEFKFNQGKNYIRKNDNYGIPALHPKNANETNIIYNYDNDFKKSLKTDGITRLDHKDYIPDVENKKGELYICSYFNIIGNYQIDKKYYMFMNGKNIEDINNNFLLSFLEISKSLNDFCISVFPSWNAKDLTINDLKYLFKHILASDNKINTWNNLYFDLSHDINSKDTKDEKNKFVVSTHAFGGNKSNRIMEIMLFIITFLVISLVIAVVVSLIKEGVIFKPKNKNNNICRQSSDII